jgi:hypothetical protein
MQFFFDESGSFAVPNDAAQHRASSIVCLAVPDHVASELERRYHDFASTLEQDERVNGEPKGSRLCDRHRKAFGDLLRRFAGQISLTPVTIDLSVLSGTAYASIAQGMADTLLEWVPIMKHDTPRENLKLLARQSKNLSQNQALRIFALAICFQEALQQAILYLSCGQFEQSWENLRFVVDRVHTKAESREEQVFSLMVLGWLAAWSETRPLMTIEEIHTPNHLIERKYGEDDGLELGRMLRDRIEWRDSASEWGLQIADMAAAIVGEAARNPTVPSATRAFARVMRSSFYVHTRGPGLFTPNPFAGEKYLDKYQPLADAMRDDQQRRSRK